MTPRDIQVTFDCADPSGLAAFWAEVLGFDVQPPPGDFATWEDALRAFGVPESEWNSRSAIVDPEETRPRIFFQRVPEGKVAKNRVHLDVRSAPGLEGDDRMAALEAAAARLLALGASKVRRIDPAPPMENGFIVMTDPEGNEFCLD